MANPTGKGGFQERPQDINRNGAPKRGQSWQETVKRITDMTREEAIAYVGPKTRLGKLLKELPPDIPIKDAMIFMAIIAFGREPSSKMFGALTDREEGRPNQPISGDVEKPLKVIIEYAQNNPTEPTPSTTEDQEGA